MSGVISFVVHSSNNFLLILAHGEL